MANHHMAPAQQPLTQEELLAFLCDPASYPHQPSSLELRQTHASYVLLVPPFVYKVKKPVDLGFLDFSTLERRRYFCEREVELNRRLCPDLYLGVVPISRSGAGLVFGVGDEIVEYAIQMHQMSADGFLSWRLSQGLVGTADIDRIVDQLQRFYTAQTPTPEIEEWGTIAQIRVNIDENFAQTAKYIGQTITQAAYLAIRDYTDRFFVAHADQFAARMLQSWIRNCHGDLHLDHIHLTPETVHIYDCIEFNDRLRYMDVACDVAFLAMDLDFSGRPDLARYFVAHMSAALADPGMLDLIEFYMCYRAYVRGKVESIRSNEPEVPATERQTSREVAQRYFRLALQYATVGAEPMVLVVMGGVATGKSTLARSLGAALGWEVYASDRIRKELAGLPVYGRSPATVRQQLYTPSATAHVYAVLIERAMAQVQAGHGVILDATFAQRAMRKHLCAVCAEIGVSYCFIETQADAALVQQRLHQREDHCDEISDARIENLPALTSAYEPPSELDSRHLITIITERVPEDALITTLNGLVVHHVVTIPKM